MATGGVAVHNGVHPNIDNQSDPFVDEIPSSNQSHRYTSIFSPESFQSGTVASPSQVKRTLEAHLLETERRLQDTQKLGTSLLQQQSELTEKLREVEQQQDEAEVSPELRQRLLELEKEHNDVGREIARAMLGPKSRAVSGEEKPAPETGTFSSQATSSPTKVTAPSRRQRNQPGNRAGDLQFAADISTSLLAQVRQLQAAVAERDDIIKRAHADQSKLEEDASTFTQRLRALDENEQRYKDENWNLETQNHDLLAATRAAAERERKLQASLAAALAEKGSAQNDLDEVKLAHGKLTEQHAAAKKAHDSELHTLRRTVEMGDSERSGLQNKIEELTNQNQELARAVAGRLRHQETEGETIVDRERGVDEDELDTPEQSPPGSPTKGTPRHGGLESETLRSSLHHAHRMIQNLKNNIHREKTEKIELKRMLQDARDELEQRRNDGPNSGSKRQKTKSDTFKKPLRPDMLGSMRRSRTDIEIEDEDWEDHHVDSPTHASTSRHLAVPGAFHEGTTDQSDAYQTANDTESAFETADEKHGTESEDFQTGAESLAESEGDLTETEDTNSRAGRGGTIRGSRAALAFRAAGDRTSYMSTASTSAGEDEDDLRTPVLNQFGKFRLKNGRQSMNRGSRTPGEGTPEIHQASSEFASSPATITAGRSPAAAEQSLYAELGDFDDASSSRFGTPGRSSIVSPASTPGVAFTPSKPPTEAFTPVGTRKNTMVDTGMMTEPWEPQVKSSSQLPVAGIAAGSGLASGLLLSHFHDKESPSPSPDHFPLPPSVPSSPLRKTDNGTQYTPQRSIHESPLRNDPNFITPPKTVWDEAHETPIADSLEPSVVSTPVRQVPFNYSSVLAQQTSPISPQKIEPITLPPPPVHAFSNLSIQHTTPILPSKAEPAPEPIPPVHMFSSIQKQQTEPKLPTFVPATATFASQGTSTDNADEATAGESRPKTAEKVVAGAAVGGLLTSAAAALGFAKSTSSKAEEAAVEESATSRDVQYLSNDQSVQTSLTASQIEEALQPRPKPTVIPPPVGLPVTSSRPTSPSAPAAFPTRSLSPSQEFMETPVASPVKRPTSAASQRSPTISTQYPPLPPDHKIAIARASGRLASPTRELSNASQTQSIMGPPAFPASAMRRPRTPADASVRSPTREGASSSRVPRPHRNTVSSQVSRRSSVSSFASELDERFNIHADAPSGSHGFEPSPGTDPRMIQAITQTMIGEYLWKYTRKPGRSELSDTRHRRYFWVHPYTKTLYWSNQDPQTAGRNELKAKSVAIQSVRVVSDDNPMPPGLHRKSLEITTPGRKIRFTASTGQRHETWFNALSYLLLRGEDQIGNEGTYSAGGNEITRDDINEFNVSGNGYGAKLVPSGSRVSMSSYNSRTTRGTSRNRSSVVSKHATPGAVATTMASTVSRTPQDSVVNSPNPTSTIRGSRAIQSRDGEKSRSIRANSVSRFSRMLGSVKGRSVNAETPVAGEGIRSETGSIYDASVVSDTGRRDSAEELRKEMLRQEEEGLGGLENVRACCDGKHDVSSLSHISRHSSSAGFTPRGVSFRGSTSRRT